jgi:hypothetical protein
MSVLTLSTRLLQVSCARYASLIKTPVPLLPHNNCSRSACALITTRLLLCSVRVSSINLGRAASGAAGRYENQSYLGQIAVFNQWCRSIHTLREAYPLGSRVRRISISHGADLKSFAFISSVARKLPRFLTKG